MTGTAGQTRFLAALAVGLLFGTAASAGTALVTKDEPTDFETTLTMSASSAGVIAVDGGKNWGQGGRTGDRGEELGTGNMCHAAKPKVKEIYRPSLAAIRPTVPSTKPAPR